MTINKITFNNTNIIVANIAKHDPKIEMFIYCDFMCLNWINYLWDINLRLALIFAIYFDYLDIVYYQSHFLRDFSFVIFLKFDFIKKYIYNKLYTLNCLSLVPKGQCNSVHCDFLQLLPGLPFFFLDGYMCSMAQRILCDIWKKCIFIHIHGQYLHTHTYIHVYYSFLHIFYIYC